MEKKHQLKQEISENNQEIIEIFRIHELIMEMIDRIKQIRLEIINYGQNEVLNASLREALRIHRIAKQRLEQLCGLN